MRNDTKTYLIAGCLGVGILAVLGYGIHLERTRPKPNAAATSGAPSASTSTPAELPSNPALRIETEARVPGNTSGHAARVVGAEGQRCEWSIQGGDIEGDNTSENLRWSAGNQTEVVLVCKCTTPDGQASAVQTRIAVDQAPVIGRFEATPAILVSGKSARLGWDVRNTKTLALDPGGLDVSGVSGPGFEVKPAKTTTYTLTATSPTGATMTRELTIQVVPAPELLSFRAEPVSGSKTDYTVIGEFKNGKAALKEGSQVLASAEASPLTLTLAPKPGSALTLSLTGPDGTVISSSLQFNK